MNRALASVVLGRILDELDVGEGVLKDILHEVHEPFPINTWLDGGDCTAVTTQALCLETVFGNLGDVPALQVVDQADVVDLFAIPRHEDVAAVVRFMDVEVGGYELNGNVQRVIHYVLLTEKEAILLNCIQNEILIKRCKVHHIQLHVLVDQVQFNAIQIFQNVLVEGQSLQFGIFQVGCLLAVFEWIIGLLDLLLQIRLALLYRILAPPIDEAALEVELVFQSRLIKVPKSILH